MIQDNSVLYRYYLLKQKYYTKKGRFFIIYTISDPHLSFAVEKPMDIFGMRWENHPQKLREEWCRVVKEEDTVIIPGDISWGSSFEEARADLEFINCLPGRKIIGKGNHDYWWATMNKLQKFKEDNDFSTIEFLFNNAFAVEDKIICGTRGWVNEFGVKTEDERIIKREANRLCMSLDEGKRLKEIYKDNEIIVFLHYPPIFGEFMNLDILDVLYRYEISRVYFGHLHNVRKEQLDSEYIGIKLNLVSCDYVSFIPQKVD